VLVRATVAVPMVPPGLTGPRLFGALRAARHELFRAGS